MTRNKRRLRLKTRKFKGGYFNEELNAIYEGIMIIVEYIATLLNLKSNKEKEQIFVDFAKEAEISPKDTKKLVAKFVRHQIINTPTQDRNIVLNQEEYNSPPIDIKTFLKNQEVELLKQILSEEDIERRLKRNPDYFN